MTTPAHAISLHLFQVLEAQKSNASGEDAVKAVSDCIVKLGLDGHVGANLSIDGQVELESLSLRGSAILQDLQMRSNVPPCPTGDCAADTVGVCKWCGRKVL